MASKTEYVVVDPHGPCPCRSGKTTVTCCMAEDGSFRVKIPSPNPAGEKTGYANPNCYMRGTTNCSVENASGPYFSDAVRDLLRTNVVSLDFPWDEPERDVAIRSENLSASTLCARHKESLAALDGVALQAFRNILDAVAYVTMKSLATKPTLTAVSGEGLELWLLKLLFGAYHMVLTTDGGTALKDFLPLDTNIFQNALLTGALAAPRGLYVRRYQTVGERDHAPADQPKRIAGLCFKIGPLEFELIVDPKDLNLDAVRSRNFYRPSGIDLIGKKRNAQIHLSGPGFATNETARFATSDARSLE